MRVSIVLAEKIMDLFEESGATELERLAALEICKALVPVTAVISRPETEQS